MDSDPEEEMQSISSMAYSTGHHSPTKRSPSDLEIVKRVSKSKNTVHGDDLPSQEAKRPNKRGQPDQLSDLASELQNHSWEHFQDRFVEEMNERSKLENILQKETADLLEVFIVWSQTTVFHDEDRAYKRLKTRMDYVQNSEVNLEEKKKHFSNVVKAFESALALLRNDHQS